MSNVQSLRELINPTERQIEFLHAVDESKYVLFGGAKGGGKSYILRWALVRQLLKWAKDGHRSVRVGLFCEDYPSLRDRQITKINKEFPTWLGTLTGSQVEGMSFILKPIYGGGVIALRNLDDVSKYASSEFAAVGVDELTKNLRPTFDQFRSIIRWPGIENTKFIAGTNPGEIGHLWVKKLWIDRHFDPEDPPQEEFKFVKSLPTDNPYNSQTYLEELKRLPEKLRKAYWDGSWDIFEGQYFTEWDRYKHVVEPFAIPDSWKRFRAYDHGRTAPACCLWFALDHDGKVWVYREYYAAGKNVDQIAQEINRLSAGETYDYSIADPAIFARTGLVDATGGQTIAESFSRQGVSFIPASNRRIDGWAIMHQYLFTDMHKEPLLTFFSTCYNSIRTIPALVHDEVKPEDIDTFGEDHAADAVRYMLVTLHERKVAAPLTDTQKKLLKLQQGDGSPVPNFYLNDRPKFR